MRTLCRFGSKIGAQRNAPRPSQPTSYDSRQKFLIHEKGTGVTGIGSRVSGHDNGKHMRAIRRGRRLAVFQTVTRDPLPVTRPVFIFSTRAWSRWRTSSRPAPDRNTRRTRGRICRPRCAHHLRATRRRVDLRARPWAARRSVAPSRDLLHLGNHLRRHRRALARAEGAGCRDCRQRDRVDRKPHLVSASVAARQRSVCFLATGWRGPYPPSAWVRGRYATCPSMRSIVERVKNAGTFFTRDGLAV